MSDDRPELERIASALERIARALELRQYGVTAEDVARAVDELVVAARGHPVSDEQ